MFGTTRVTMEFYSTHIFQNVGGLKAGTHWPKRCSSEAFGETRTRSGTNMFGVFSCVGSFQSSANVVGSDSSCEVWGGGPWDVWAIGFSDWLCASWMAALIGGVLVNQRGVWEGGILCALCFSMHFVPSFPVFMLCSTGTRLVVMSIQDKLICVHYNIIIFVTALFDNNGNLYSYEKFLKVKSSPVKYREFVSLVKAVPTGMTELIKCHLSYQNVNVQTPSL